jgi:hypothetical protein
MLEDLVFIWSAERSRAGIIANQPDIKLIESHKEM